MRILAVSDLTAKRFYDYYKPGSLKPYDLILACGDLDPSYLEFLVTMAQCPVLYVHGNHDEKYDRHPPEGCDCIDDDLYLYKGIRFLGLGGSYRYRDGKYMYTEQQMRCRIIRLMPKIMKYRGFDVLVTHAPARGIHDLDTQAHRGFACFNRLIQRYKPKFFIHGHIHMNYDIHISRLTQLDGTTVINATEYYDFEYPEKP